MNCKDSSIKCTNKCITLNKIDLANALNESQTQFVVDDQFYRKQIDIKGKTNSTIFIN